MTQKLFYCYPPFLRDHTDGIMCCVATGKAVARQRMEKHLWNAYPHGEFKIGEDILGKVYESETGVIHKFGGG